MSVNILLYTSGKFSFDWQTDLLPKMAHLALSFNVKVQLSNRDF